MLYRGCSGEIEFDMTDLVDPSLCKCSFLQRLQLVQPQILLHSNHHSYNKQVNRWIQVLADMNLKAVNIQYQFDIYRNVCQYTLLTIIVTVIKQSLKYIQTCKGDTNSCLKCGYIFAVVVHKVIDKLIHTPHVQQGQT